ncbi:cytochrome c oxidase assembly protein [Evansella sp. AB-P1]|uniref:cytochrome c oxidase assembly protein n=1 Tax=Evansella sp. AB-P1 TaxID=3037653 RepID=UPI00241E678B|nr:cytochrome c oxidase assembly protein [Evansella sp. AB-P1]MDG5787162.1 cytochrome c oxidase assembly protein [Evansella sp. AB-P1]
MNLNNHIHSINHHEIGIVPQLILAIPFLLLLVTYITAVIVSNRRLRKWPFYRIILWIFGTSCVVVSIIGPVAEWSHTNFSIHMLVHLLFGMAAPLVMALGAPMTLFMRTIPVSQARRLSKALKSRFIVVICNPVVASILNVGGLWLLYTTSLYSYMHQHTVLYVLVHFHVFIAGYLFTISIIYIDPIHKRTHYIYRAIVLIFALAGHGILSKYIYAHPPLGVPIIQGEIGGIIMYYGGDAVDIVIVIFLCYQWFRATRPRSNERSFAI